jgi:hypothetical protein
VGHRAQRDPLHPVDDRHEEHQPRAALADEAAEVRSAPADAYLSSNRTCEIGLRQATGAPYESVVHVLERATR